MNCQAIQNKILVLTDPRVIPDALREHVVGCGVCRAWARQAARLEGFLQQLPVPPAPSNRKATVVDELTRNEPVIILPPTMPVRPGFTVEFLRLLERNKMVLGGLAAAVLVVLGGWWLLTPRPSAPEVTQEAPKHPFLKKLTQRDVALANALKPTDRLHALGGLAEDLSTEARSLALVASPDEMRDLARWFDKVVKDGVVKQAEKMPVDTLRLSDRAERKTELDALASKLNDMATQAEKMTGSVPQDAKAALQKIADSAHSGEKKLRAMASAG